MKRNDQDETENEILVTDEILIGVFA